MHYFILLLCGITIATPAPSACSDIEKIKDCTPYCECRWCYFKNKCYELGEYNCSNHTTETRFCKQHDEAGKIIGYIFIGIGAIVCCSLFYGCAAFLLSGALRKCKPHLEEKWDRWTEQKEGEKLLLYGNNDSLY